MKNIILILIAIPLLNISLFSQKKNSDQSDTLWSMVIPKAESMDIDMQSCLVGSTRDTLIAEFIKNTGSYTFTVLDVKISGTDASSFIMSSGHPIFQLERATSSQAEFQFRPKRPGMHNANIVIITQADTLTYRIFGNAIEPTLEIVNRVIDFGKVEVGTARDTTQVMTVKNNSLSKLLITSTYHNKPNDIDFSTIGGAAPFELESGEIATMDLRFLPSQPGRTNGLLEFHFKGTGSPASILLIGEGIDRVPILAANLLPVPQSICNVPTTASLELSNQGSMELTVSQINILGIHSAEFTLLTPLPIIISPNETETVSIRFNPIVRGPRTAQLEIVSNSAIEPIRTIPIIGKKQEIEIKVNRTEINIGNIEESQSVNDNFIVLNSGTISTNVEFTSSNNIDFDRKNLALGANRSETINFTFTANQPAGPINEQITITDSICNTITIISLIGMVRDAQKPALLANINPFKALICDDSDDAILMIKNTGNEVLNIYSITIEGADADNFSIVSSTSTSIAKGESNSVIIRFSPIFYGTKNAEIVIRSNSVPDDIVYISIIGIKENIEIDTDESSISFGNLEISQTANADLLISNNSTIETSIKVTPSQNISISQQTFNLMPLEDKTIIIDFLGTTQTGEFNELITIEELTCNTKSTVPISGFVSQASTIARGVLSIGNATASAGETIYIPISLNNTENLVSSGITSIDVDLTYNHTLLSPVSVPFEIISPTTAKMTIQNMPANEGVIANIKFHIGLGNSDSSVLLPTNPRANGGSSNLATESGVFTLSELCYEGGKRLIEPNSQAQISRVSPNPTSGKIDISIALNEIGFTSLILYNIFGEMLANLFDEYINSPKPIDLTISLENLPTGQYILLLKTPTYIENKLIILAK